MSADDRLGDLSSTERSGTSQQLVKKYMLLSMATGLVPVPVVDVAALTAIQLQLLAKLAKQYDITFSEQLATSVLGSLVGAGGSTLATVTSHRLLMRLHPVGWVVTAVTTAIFAGASTYAVGRVFVQHFDSGGTFLTFDPEKVRDFYAAQLKEGSAEVARSFAGVKP